MEIRLKWQMWTHVAVNNIAGWGMPRGGFNLVLYFISLHGPGNQSIPAERAQLERV